MSSLGMNSACPDDRSAPTIGIRLGLATLAVATALAGPPISPARGEEPPAAVAGVPAGSGWRSPMYCGVNSVYTFLRLNGVSVEHRQVEEAIPVGLEGSTLKDMRAAAAGFGLRSRVVRATPEQLVRCSLPVVAHVEDDSRNEFDRGLRGHFVVVVAADPESVSYIDGTLGIIKAEAADSFLRQWTGLLLVRDDDRPLAPYTLVGLGAAGCLLLAIGAGLARAWRPSTGATTPPGPTGIE